jgi:hypothetical protein
LHFWELDNTRSREHIKYLHDINDAFGDRLTIITVALDEDPRRIERFREEWPMPWIHATASYTSSSVQGLGVTGTPHTVLIDRHGIVLSNNEEDINDERLYSLLEGILD